MNSSPDQQSPVSDWRLILRAFSALAPYKKEAVLLLAVLVANSLASTLPYLVVKDVLDRAIRHGNLHDLLVDCILLAVFPVVGHLLNLAQIALNTKLGQAILRDLRNQLYAHLHRMPLAFFTHTRGGEIYARFTSDIGGLQSFLTNTLSDFVSGVLAMTTTLALMLYISPALTLLLVLVLPAFLFNHFWTSARRRPLYRRRQQIAAKISGFISETLSINGVLLAKTFGRQQVLKDKFKAKNEELSEVEIRQQMIGGWGFMGFGGLLAFVPALIFLVAGWQIISGTPLLGVKMTLGTLLVFSALQGRFFAPAIQISTIQVNIQIALPLFERIYEYLNLPVEISDAPNALSLTSRGVRGDVEFHDVSFCYRRPPLASPGIGADQTGVGEANGSKPVLKHIDFSIPAGKMVALVGRSGAGKTTIGYLVPRLYDVGAGRVTIDGHDVRDIKLASLSEIVGVVTQEPYLLHATVRENLLFGNGDATDEAMFAAARAAAIHDRILELDQGYDTIVGERGYCLSGGEKQRLAIARVILKNPRILVLDEATSALDTHSERLVQMSLNALVHGRTTLVIAHRLSTILSADMILVVDNGEIVERGTHHELLAANRHYAHLYWQQFGSDASATSVNPPRHPVAAVPAVV